MDRAGDDRRRSGLRKQAAHARARRRGQPARGPRRGDRLGQADVARHAQNDARWNGSTATPPSAAQPESTPPRQSASIRAAPPYSATATTSRNTASTPKQRRSRPTAHPATPGHKASCTRATSRRARSSGLERKATGSRKARCRWSSMKGPLWNTPRPAHAQHADKRSKGGASGAQKHAGSALNVGMRSGPRRREDEALRAPTLRAEGVIPPGDPVDWCAAYLNRCVLVLCMERSRERKHRSGDYAAPFLREAAVSVWRDQLGSSRSRVGAGRSGAKALARLSERTEQLVHESLERQRLPAIGPS